MRFRRFEFAQTSFEFCDPRMGSLEDTLLDLEVVAGDEVEAFEERRKERSQILFDVACRRFREHFGKPRADFVDQSGVGHGDRRMRIGNWHIDWQANSV